MKLRLFWILIVCAVAYWGFVSLMPQKPLSTSPEVQNTKPLPQLTTSVPVSSSADNQCKPSEADHEAVELLRLEQHQVLKMLFKQWYQVHRITIAELELMGLQAGLTYWHLQDALPMPIEVSNHFDVAGLIEGLSWAGNDEVAALDTLIVEQQLYNVASILGQEADKKLYQGMPLFTYVLDRTSQPSDEPIEQLIGLGFRPAFVDLIWGLRRELDTTGMLALIEHNRAKTDVYWSERSGVQSFAVLAAQNYRHALLKSWFNKTAGAERALISELDVIPVPDPKAITAALTTVETLLASGKQVHSQTGYERLMAWLPESWLDRHAGKIARPKIDVTVSNPALQEELTQVVKDFEVRTMKLKGIAGQCLTAELSRRSERNVPHHFSLARKQALFQQGLASITRNNYLGRLMRRSMEGTAGHNKQALIDALLMSRWAKASPLIDSYLATEHQDLVLDLAMEQALQNGAPLSFVLSLMAKGAVLPHDAIRTLAILDHLELAAGLLNYGLDVHHVDELGMNALSYLADTSDDILGPMKMFHFLLGLQVSVTPSSQGLDPLNFALAKVKHADTAMTYAQWLVDAGAIPDRSHIQQLQQLKLAAPQKYRALIAKVPALQLP